jgi:hypothetical protein
MTVRHEPGKLLRVRSSGRPLAVMGGPPRGPLRWQKKPRAGTCISLRCPGVSGQGSNRIFAGKDGGSNVGGQESQKVYSGV